MPEETAQQSKPKSDLFGGSILLKILFVIGIIIVVALVLLVAFFGTLSISALITYIIAFIVGGGLIFFALKGVMGYLKPKPFSPTEDFRTKLIRMGMKVKPLNVYNLWLRGEDMRSKALIGRIEGIGFIPYLSQSPKRDEKGNVIYEVDDNGEIIYEEYKEKGKTLKKPKPQYDYITEKDGDILFIVPKHKGLIGLIKRDVDLIRANPKFVSDILGDIFIKDVNVVPYGEYYYPSKQWGKDIIRIMRQHESEAITQTHRNWLDLASNLTQLSLASSPEFQKIMLAQSERITSVSGGV